MAHGSIAVLQIRMGFQRRTPRTRPFRLEAHTRSITLDRRQNPQSRIIARHRSRWSLFNLEHCQDLPD